MASPSSGSLKTLLTSSLVPPQEISLEEDMSYCTLVDPMLYILLDL
jgi:hypothetical protein